MKIVMYVFTEYKKKHYLIIEPAEFVDVVINPDFWSEGVAVNKFFQKRQQPNSDRVAVAYRYVHTR